MSVGCKRLTEALTRESLSAFEDALVAATPADFRQMLHCVPLYAFLPFRQALVRYLRDHLFEFPSALFENSVRPEDFMADFEARHLRRLSMFRQASQIPEQLADMHDNSFQQLGSRLLPNLSGYGTATVKLFATLIYGQLESDIAMLLPSQLQARLVLIGQTTTAAIRSQLRQANVPIDNWATILGNPLVYQAAKLAAQLTASDFQCLLHQCTVSVGAASKASRV